MKSLLLLGSGGHCKSCIDVIEISGKFNIRGIIIHPDESIKKFMNYEVIGNDINICSLFKKDDLALICVGQIKSFEKRKYLFDLLKENRISLATVKSRFAIVSKNALIGEGSIVMHNAIINSGAQIGRNCILNTNSLLEHDAKIGSHCHISTGAIINGGTKIGNGCFIGSGATLREGIEIGDNTIISAGRTVLEDLPPKRMWI